MKDNYSATATSVSFITNKETIFALPWKLCHDLFGFMKAHSVLNLREVKGEKNWKWKCSWRIRQRNKIPGNSLYKEKLQVDIHAQCFTSRLKIFIIALKVWDFLVKSLPVNLQRLFKFRGEIWNICTCTDSVKFSHFVFTIPWQNMTLH